VKSIETERLVPWRYPRLSKDDDVELVAFVTKLRRRYPAPAYDPIRDGSYDPASWILDWLLRQRKSKLRELCDKHALKTTGSKKKLIQRQYLHWRSLKLGLGKIYYGYGKHHEFTRPPDCICNCLKVSEMEKLREDKMNRKAANKRAKEQSEIRRFPREIMRFPRPFRFPRLKEKKAS
jgi:hypothetical protein